jgi:hypothetical protein
MSKRKSDDHAAELPSPPEIVCILVVNAMIDEIEIEICCQRTNGVDRVFSTSMDWLHAERPSESTLAHSVETLLFDITARCLRYVGEPVDVRAGLLSKGHVWAIITGVGLAYRLRQRQFINARGRVPAAVVCSPSLQTSRGSKVEQARYGLGKVCTVQTAFYRTTSKNFYLQPRCGAPANNQKNACCFFHDTHYAYASDHDENSLKSAPLYASNISRKS